MSAQHISDSEFQEKVVNSKKPVLVDFYADWCGPCRAMAPTIDEISSENSDKYDIYKLDVDANQQTAGMFNVMSIPTLIFFKNGKPANMMVGVQSKETILKELKSLE